MLFSKEPQAMDMLPPIPHILCVHVQGLATLNYNQYTGMLSIQATE